MTDYTKVKVLLTDEVHFHRRNFNSLFNFFESCKVNVTNANAPKDWISLYGNYFAKSSDLRKGVVELSYLSKEDLKNLEYKGINIFEMCKMEFLSHVMAKPSWRSLDLQSDDVYKYAYELDYDALIHNMAAVKYWIDWWENKLKHIPHQHYVCIFSGSLIYVKVLIEILKKHVAEPVVMESFFTGNEYYCEKKYEHLPNNSDLKFDTYYKSISILGSYDRDRVKSINKIALSNNKNVKQPSIEDSSLLSPGKKRVLVIGQVLNDFSILGGGGVINSLSWYKKIISGLILKTDFDVVFKSHPWEHKKTGLGTSVTKKELEFYSSNFLDETERGRFQVVEDYNLELLISQCDYVVTLCSQSALEAAFLGYKPVQFLDAFYGGKGFTSDYCDVDDFIDDLNEGQVGKYLTLSEFDKFEEFCVKSLMYHLVSVHASGVNRLKEIFRPVDVIPLVKASSSAKKKGVLKAQAEISLLEKQTEKKEQKLVVDNVGNNASIKDSSSVESELSSPEYRAERRRRLFNKFKRDPYKYFDDSKNKYERLLRFLFRKR